LSDNLILHIKDLNKINELLVLYEELGYPTKAEDLFNRLKKIYNKSSAFVG
jgi:hypothetical protein